MIKSLHCRFCCSSRLRLKIHTLRRPLEHRTAAFRVFYLRTFDTLPVSVPVNLFHGALGAFTIWPSIRGMTLANGVNSVVLTPTLQFRDQSHSPMSLQTRHGNPRFLNRCL